jgi:threonine synthase
LRDEGVTMPIHAVQTEGCAPLAAAWVCAHRVGLAEAPRHWHECMRPWPTTPASAATGILDDETYDWLGVVEGMAASRGWPVVAPERTIKEAHELAVTTTGIAVSVTGTAGLAGLLAIRDEVDDAERVAVVFTGVER